MGEMPPGTIGFEATGEVEDDDWGQAVEPVLRREIAEGRKVRLVYLLGAAVREVEGDAMAANSEFRARHATSFDRVVVSAMRTGCARHCARCRSLLPGKAKGFAVHDLPAAKAWLADGIDG